MTARTLASIVLVLCLPAALRGQNVEAEDIEARFAGHYELVSFESFRANGDVVDMQYVGRIMYDGHGNMSAIGMPKNLPERARQSDENVQAGFAYWGTVSFDVPNGIVIHHVQGSPTRGSWPGVDNVRHFRFTDDGLLKLSIKNEEGRTTSTLTWRRIPGPAGRMPS
ncbi:MAG: lipocalin-like domain-containing protein [Gemmatimonadota bacterium]|nr:lipocalin-like domain-containing protein [Gemmatimonadota bacterium]